MAIRVALHHKTDYRYDRLVTLSPQVVRLRPAPHCRTPIVAYSLKIEPREHFINWQQDPQNNFIARAVFPNQVRHFSVQVDLVAEITVSNPFDFFLEPYAETSPFVYEEGLLRELSPNLVVPLPGPRLAAFVAATDLTPRRTVEFLVELNQRVQHAVRYVIRLEPGIQSCEETLALGSGSCRDSAWLLVEILRNLGFAARFVSGYLIQLKPDVKALDGPVGTDRDFADLHAWAEVYLPGAGWIGLDPTSGLFTGEGHLPLASTPDAASAAPVTGAIGPCEVEFGHEMSVTRIHEDPRVTLPYSDEQWARIDALGVAIDAEIIAGDVRLTMGGEPTFVALENSDDPQWHTAALGPQKRELAERLLGRLQERFAPGGLLHYGQGKWYPGEPLPRWALACYWRTDGVPIWRDRALIARVDAAYAYGPHDAQRFIAALAERLGVDPGYAIAGFEDPLYYHQRERQLPINVAPVDNRLDDPVDREQVRRAFARGVETPVGYVLPLQWGHVQEGFAWQSGRWLLRSVQLYLMPGDSPMGLRLPLASLPWVAPADLPPFFTSDPMAPPESLPYSAPCVHPNSQPGAPLATKPRAPTDATRDRIPAVGESAPWVVRTALCVEVRDGRLHVFMPPAHSASEYLELINKVEDTAAALKTPIVIEGYTPPSDPRINRLAVTPDPGVIEVNVQPAHTWTELREIITGMYEDARICRLSTEKFMVDGRHAGTGGGNHIALGASTAADSPFLRRPDLLRSMLGYWLNHPALSYLFSGLFIGPTSQAPRIDETRQDSLYELEIAFAQVSAPEAKDTPPWLVDRIFRHILVDVTGNTHRAEFCIDKLYSPDSASGRLGLLELRGFEMPPDARMSLTQQLLVRALVAWFWREPYRVRPTEWGTQLHDRFMLPHFVISDLVDVIGDLRRAGYRFELDWFAPHIEFRYPRIGRVSYAGVDLELRQATEPWYVLGEETSVGGTARYVDSSVERLQVKVDGLNGERYAVTCNGRRVPLHPTGVRGEFIAGVRYRAWQPPSCLHPTIPVHAPLVFDVVDTWSGRSVGGCTYNVSHPGGLNYETFPVNANEAEARRAARFVPFGHTPGPLPTPPRETNPYFPLTLDLRWSSAADDRG
jgi:uncharacterized protein (DUF2126 family)/transglutaminase-like putative cysteine protease